MSRIHIRWKLSLLWALGALCGGLLASGAQAASFNCAKATTNVEHMICDDPELSRLDEKMGKAYRAALARTNERATLVRSQRLWLTELREVCHDTLCLHMHYRTRIERLIVTQAHPKPPYNSNNGSTESTPTFPPYPDVWGWELNTKHNALPIQLSLLSNGDVVAGYVFTGKKLLFSGNTVISGELHNQRNSQANGVLTLSDGRRVRVTKQGDVLGRMKLPNGLVVETIDNSLVECYHGPIRYSLRIFDPKTSVYRASKVVFLLLDKPRRYMWDRPKVLPGTQAEVDPCAEEGPPGYHTRVQSISGAGMLPLPDSTFLMPIGDRLVVRFDQHLNTRSPLLNRRFFVFDLNGSNLFIDQITHKTYDLRKSGSQPVYDDLYRYLSELKGSASHYFRNNHATSPTH